MNARLIRIALIGLAALLVLGGIARVFAPQLAGSRIRAVARARGLDASWRSLEVRGLAGARVRGLLVRTIADGDTVLAAEELDVALRIAPLLAGHARPAAVDLEHATVRLPHASRAGADSLALGADLEADETPAKGEVAVSVRRRADALVNALLAPARTLPTLHLRDVTLARGEDAGATITALDLSHELGAENLSAAGVLHGERDVPFDALVRWQRDDRLTGRAEFRVGDATPPSPASVVMTIDGRVTQDRRAREVRIAEGTVAKIGSLAAKVSARVAAKGPRFTLAIEADTLTAGAFRRSLPADVLGPLSGLALRGSFDWRAGFDLDLDHPDSVTFHADVIPHGLSLDPAMSRPSLGALAAPFTAQIHLPHDRIVTRELSDANPHFRSLDRISPFLRDALITNEDGGFWRHRGFNTEAIGLAVAANLRAGQYKRGAGTITMQLARNLWLGHQRTLSRKGQEVALAWLLEHQSGLPKERLLEIYLNIIEWGPDVHGADEAAQYYFAEDAANLTLTEALFLTIVVPSPTKWRWRFDKAGTLRPFAQAQMHFIANKMASKGWLDPTAVPPAESLGVTLRGPAAALFAAPDSSAAPADSAATPDTPI